MPRTNATLVRESVEVKAGDDLDVHINRAYSITNLVSSRDTDGLLDSSILLEIETLLACYSYRLKYPQYSSKSTGGASGSWGAVDFWKEAKKYDLTGTLASMEAGYKKSSFDWLGKPESQQVDYWDRD